MIKREYPDIEFVETDTETIENSLIALWELMYEKMTGKKKKVYPASPERLYIAYTAAIIVQQRIIINETAKKNVPRYANGKYLDSLGELFKDTFRLPEARATAIFRFHISEPQPQSVIVPQGTRINFDGEIVFATTEELEIKAGEEYGDILGECLTPGIVGNNIAAGQIKEIMDTYDYFWKVENITRTAGGADKESDQSYYERLRESMEGFSTAGPVGGYIYHVKSVSTAIADVTATSPEPGLVDIRVLLNGGEMPTEATMQEIQDALNASTVRPLTDRVIVSKPEEVPFSVDVTIYLPRYSQTSSTIIERDARSAVAAYIKWQTEKMGRDINPSRLHNFLMEAGLKRAEIRKPDFTVVPETSVARLTGETVLNGGTEDE
ncbi:MAG: baseplate J/gp47 family protein [Dysosmobacter sp.]|nr:baseplate J/gp47 family protein [Dysosmobacter sp.]